jgi:hypothetical protein
MLEIRRSAVSFDESDLIEMERILIDSDEKGALVFLKRAVHDRIMHAQQGKLKSHLDGTDPVEGFVQRNQRSGGEQS